MTYANTRFDLWWCCQPSCHQALLVQLALTYTGGTGYIKKDDFETIYSFCQFPPHFPERNAFVRLYGLIYGTTTDIEGTTIEVYFFEDSFYVPLVTFVNEPQANCTKPCRLLTYPI